MLGEDLLGFAAQSEYRTKRVIFETYDEMARAVQTGQPCRTRLSPPPGAPTDPDGSFAPLPAWKRGDPRHANWPRHIHPLKAVHLAGDDR